MTDHKHPTRVIYHPDPANAPAELHAQYIVKRDPLAVVIDDGVSLTGGPPPPASILIPDTVGGEIVPHTIPVPLPAWLNLGRGRLVRDDAARGWRFEPEVAR